MRSLLLLIVLAIMGWAFLIVRNRQIRAYHDYYLKTEVMLDSLCAQDTSFPNFTNSKVYREYIRARNRLEQ